MNFKRSSRRWSKRASPILRGAIARSLFIITAWAAPASAAEPPARSRAEAALERLERESQGATPRVLWPRDRIAPALITGLSARMPGTTLAARAQAFVARHHAALGVEPAALELEIVRERGAQTFVRYRQLYGALPVEGAGITFGFDGDRIVSVSNETRPIERVRTATLDETHARLLALQFVDGVPAGDLGRTQVAFHGFAVLGANAVEIYRVAVMRRPFLEHLEVMVDAHSGRVVGASDRAIR